MWMLRLGGGAKRTACAPQGCQEGMKQDKDVQRSGWSSAGHRPESRPSHHSKAGRHRATRVQSSALLPF